MTWYHCSVVPAKKNKESKQAEIYSSTRISRNTEFKLKEGGWNANWQISFKRHLGQAGFPFIMIGRLWPSYFDDDDDILPMYEAGDDENDVLPKYETGGPIGRCHPVIPCYRSQCPCQTQSEKITWRRSLDHFDQTNIRFNENQNQSKFKTQSQWPHCHQWLDSILNIWSFIT